MSEEVPLHLIVAAFDEEAGAEEALKTLKESREEELVGIQAAREHRAQPVIPHGVVHRCLDLHTS